MLPMSNNASNGRNSSSSNNSCANIQPTTSISNRNDTTTINTTINTQSNNNDSNKHITITHRRDHSRSISGGQNCKKDVRKYQYAKPQALLQPKQVQDAPRKSGESGDVDSTATYAETVDASQMLVYYEANLISGSLEALIAHMVPTSSYYPERTYVFSFLLSARLFIRPHELLAQIAQTWEQQQQQLAAASNSVDVVDDANFSQQPLHLPPLLAASVSSPLAQRKTGTVERTVTQKSAQNCIRLLSEWIETFPYDFRDERLMQQVRILARKCVYIDNSLGKQVSRILQLLVQRLTALEKYEEFLQSLLAADLNGSQQQQQHYSTSASASYGIGGGASNHHAHNTLALKLPFHHAEAHTNSSSSTPYASTSSSSSAADASTHDVLGLMDMCPSCAHLAHQLTAIELERLSHIGPEEFVQAFAKEYQHSIENKASDTKNSAMTASLNDMKKTRNLESYVEWFNRLSYLTASEIVKYPKKKQRVRIIEYWIETARECFNIGNFNSLMAIIAGLNLAPISRLKKTWSKVQSAKFSVLEHQMDPTSNFNSYRSTLKAAMWRSEGATDERERIIIPFFSLFVKDLYFLNEGCSNRLPNNNHINFEKCSQLAKQVMEFNEWKKVTCPFEQLPNIIAFLQNTTVLNENTLSMASFECEPPENSEEKERYKTVKAETKQQLLQQLQEQQQ